MENRMELYRELLDICLRHGNEFNEFLIKIKSSANEDDFNHIRKMIAECMAGELFSAINPIVDEFPSLRPPELD